MLNIMQINETIWIKSLRVILKRRTLQYYQYTEALLESCACADFHGDDLSESLESDSQ